MIIAVVLLAVLIGMVAGDLALVRALKRRRRNRAVDDDSSLGSAD